MMTVMPVHTNMAPIERRAGFCGSGRFVGITIQPFGLDRLPPQPDRWVCKHLPGSNLLTGGHEPGYRDHITSRDLAPDSERSLGQVPNVQIETRWAGINADDIRRHAAELVALAPDVILAQGASTVGPLLQASRTVPIVFPLAGDPVGAGFVDSLSRPGGNATGFMTMEYSMSGKWLELLKQIAPGLMRTAVLRDPGNGDAEHEAYTAVAWGVGVSHDIVFDALKHVFAQHSPRPPVRLRGVPSDQPCNKILRRDVPKESPIRVVLLALKRQSTGQCQQRSDFAVKLSV